MSDYTAPTLADIEHLTGPELDNYQPDTDTPNSHCICPPGTPKAHLDFWGAYECARCRLPVIVGHSPNAHRQSLAEFRREKARDEYMIHGDDQ